MPHTEDTGNTDTGENTQKEKEETRVPQRENRWVTHVERHRETPSENIDRVQTHTDIGENEKRETPVRFDLLALLSPVIF